MTNRDIIFPYYSGNIRFTKVIGYVSLNSFINAHRHPTQETIDVLDMVKEAVVNEDWELKRLLKHKLYSFTPSVLIQRNCKRNYGNVLEFTGLMQLDFDKIETHTDAVNLKYALFNNNKEVLCCYLSPSGLGVKAIIKITKPTNKKHYKAIHKAVTNKYQEYSYFDESTKNAVLPLFLSIDSLIEERDWEEADMFIDEDWSEPKYVQLNEAPPTSNNSDDYYHNKTIKLFEDKISRINEYGHPQVRSACLILGSRAGAGYITKNHASDIAAYQIKLNQYLSKGTKGYLDTAEWCIEQGYKNPKHYK